MKLIIAFIAIASLILTTMTASSMAQSNPWRENPTNQKILGSASNTFNKNKEILFG